MKLRQIYPADNRRMFRAMARGNVDRAAWLRIEHLQRYARFMVQANDWLGRRVTELARRMTDWDRC